MSKEQTARGHSSSLWNTAIILRVQANSTWEKRLHGGLSTLYLAECSVYVEERVLSRRETSSWFRFFVGKSVAEC